MPPSITQQSGPLEIGLVRQIISKWKENVGGGEIYRNISGFLGAKCSHCALLGCDITMVLLTTLSAKDYVVPIARTILMNWEGCGKRQLWPI